jgi:prevent-host-death family protein
MKARELGIGQVKRDLSELVNRVAYSGERIILTSRGKPKAALVSIDDFQHIIHRSIADRNEQWKNWQAEGRSLAEGILERREGEPLDVAALWKAAREDLEIR